MKLLPIVLCCVIIIDYKFANAQREDPLQAIFKKIHVAQVKIKSDLHNFSETIKADIQKIVKPSNDKNSKGDEKTNNEEVLVFGTSSTPSPSNADGMVFPTDEPEQTFIMPDRVKATEKPVATTVSPKGSNATETEGKENFVGGCLAGFQRTVDGRCMPTY